MLPLPPRKHRVLLVVTAAHICIAVLFLARFTPIKLTPKPLKVVSVTLSPQSSKSKLSCETKTKAQNITKIAPAPSKNLSKSATIANSKSSVVYKKNSAPKKTLAAKKENKKRSNPVKKLAKTPKKMKQKEIKPTKQESKTQKNISKKLHEIKKRLAEATSQESKNNVDQLAHLSLASLNISLNTLGPENKKNSLAEMSDERHTLISKHVQRTVSLVNKTPLTLELAISEQGEILEVSPHHILLNKRD